MHDFFSNIKTLNSLKAALVDEKDNREQINITRLNNYVEKLYNVPGSSKIVAEWCNGLIVEYNESYKSFSSQEKCFYNECLFKVFEYFLPFFATYEKLVALIDMCSLTDDEDEVNSALHKEYFEISVYNATKYEDEISFLKNAYDDENDNNLLFLLGFFNFRIQEYDLAIRYLKPCVERLSKRTDNDEAIEVYIKSIIYLAESYEYKQGCLNDALEYLIGFTGIRLKERLKKIWKDISLFLFNNYPNCSKDKDSFQCVQSFFSLLYEQEKTPTTNQVFRLKHINDSLKHFVHVTAHCLSEYAMECMLEVAGRKNRDEKEIKEEIRIYSLLQLSSRFLMDWLVIQDDSFVTCQATIRAENDACPEAIDILARRLDELYKQNKEDKKEEIAELQFYLFYFAEQELDIYNNNDNLIKDFNKYGDEFYRYAEESNDTNALFHYLVIKFKYLLKKSTKDVLERINDADFSKLDETYYKINECRKEPLPHVFHDLIAESERLIKAYLLFREYRYLFVENPDPCIVQEFNNRQGLRNIESDSDTIIIDETDDEEIDISDINLNSIKYLVDEIEAKKRILILAPVKGAPSCSLDYSSVNQLCLLDIHKRTNTCDDSSIYEDFMQVAEEYNPKSGMNRCLQCNNIDLIKWAFYYDDAIKGLFIYYSEHRHNLEGEMLCAKLNEKEKKQLDALLMSIKSLIKNKVKRIDCDKNEHYKLYGSKSGCRTWLMPGGEMANYSKLLEILIFAEFDFYSSKQNCMIDSNDYIMFNYNEQYGKKYKIVCFNKLPDTGKEGICNYCSFIDLLSIQSSNKDIDNVKVHNANCYFNDKPVNLDELARKINEKIQQHIGRGRSAEAVYYRTLDTIYKTITSKCNIGTCKMNVEGRGEDCDLLHNCNEYGISIPNVIEVK